MLHSWPYIVHYFVLPIKSIFHKYANIHYHLYVDDLQIYISFPSSSDSYLIKMFMFNCITNLTKWFYHNSLSLNMTITDTIIFYRPSSPLSINHPFLLSLPSSQSIKTIGFTITSHLEYSPHINNMIRTVNYFLYNI